jgi:O-acetyl-ADP-ribose deacetylase
VTILEAILGDITRESTDAIVNAANTELAAGGGVCGAIHRAAGPDLARACQVIGKCETGGARITPGFNLSARYVIHAVGPVWQGGKADEAKHLAACYQASVDLAVDYRLESVAFPCISTGIYGYPIQEATEIALRTVRSQVSRHPGIALIRFVCFSEGDLEVYRALLL